MHARLSPSHLRPRHPWRSGCNAWICWTENSPGFFAGRPVLLDLNILKPEVSEIAGLVSELADRGIRIYAIEANGIDALGPDLPPLLIGAKEAVVDEAADAGLTEDSKPAPSAQTVEPPAPGALIIDTPIRSGQSVYHPDGDVIVLGSVGSGSEIFAGGSVHVYGTLRGRAFAGATGNAEARIFCRKNEAELLAVDGWYRTAEDMEPSARGGPIQVYLDNGMIFVAALN